MFNSNEKALFSKKAEKGLCSHAYIIDGASGIGKLDFALYCARAMLCTSDRSKPCGFCSSCQKAQSGDHPDIFIIGKEKTASVAEVRELIRRAGLKPNDGEKQIFIVCNAGKLRADSQNALLKLFEEPPETVALFLLTESRSALLPTVLSRGQRIHLDGIPDAELFEALRDKFGNVADSELNAAVSLASGNLGVAEKFLSKENAALRAKAETLLTLALSKNAYGLTTALITPKFKRDQLSAILNEVVSALNEAQKRKYGVSDTLMPKNSDAERLLAAASKRALAKMSEASLLCIQSLENNANVTTAASKLSIELLSAASAK
ncbi:MAG: hypothetical protein IJO64_02585 [Clostridia bacterium]|nr:hypothetical protein [Clostridia bacterium]